MAEALTKAVGASWLVGKDGSAELGMYVFYDPATEDESDIEAAADAAFPSTYIGYVLRKIKYKEHGYGMVEAIGHYTTYQITSANAGDNPGVIGVDFTPPDFAFEIDTVDVNVKTSFSIVSSGSVAGRAIPGSINPNIIGQKPDGTVEGVMVPQVVHRFSETHHFAAVSGTYKATLKALAGKVNFGAAFRDHEAGEVLFNGVTGGQVANGLWALQFRFSVIENITGLSIAGLTINKKGWDVIEWYTSDADNTTNKLVEKVIDGYRVHRVLTEGNFALLGIGS